MERDKVPGAYSENSIELMVSLIDGVGVFATHCLNSGIELFTGWQENSRFYTQEEFESLGKLGRFPCRYLDGYIGPDRFDNMHLSWFMNHSDSPNVGVIGGSKGKYVSLREIQKGEELVIDYELCGAMK